jgi:hypothetical protein
MPGGEDVTYRNDRKYPLLIAAAVLGSVLSAAPAQAALAPSDVNKAAAGCYWRHVDGHVAWFDGRQHWVPAQTIWVCAGTGGRAAGHG